MPANSKTTVMQRTNNFALFYEVRMQYERSSNGQLLEFTTHNGTEEDAISLFQLCFPLMSFGRPRKTIVLEESIFQAYTFSLPPTWSNSLHQTFTASRRSKHTLSTSRLENESKATQIKDKGVDDEQKSSFHVSYSIMGVIRVYEMHKLSHISGILLLDASSSKLAKQKTSDYNYVKKSSNWNIDLEFRTYFALVLLGQGNSHWTTRQSSPSPGKILNGYLLAKTILVSEICELFEMRLLFRGTSTDQWHVPGKGRDRFKESIGQFVEKKNPVMFCLPAFPCKSSNLRKVASSLPDGAEYEALNNLHLFCHELGRFYPPGCHISIVSDGYVFSDCIGVDDEIVMMYNSNLREMSEQIHENLRRDFRSIKMNPITFTDLYELLFPTLYSETLFKMQYIDKIQLTRLIQTQTTSRGEMCRKLLMHICASSDASLKSVIRDDPRSALTTLYRGFSRFMLEDLTSNPNLCNKSIRQRKKIARMVGLEMMHRNQAYSHLVELALPRHVRLSIHAHNNIGPKFAISLLRRDQFQVRRSLEGIQLAAKRDIIEENVHLHIPTPWHNVIVEIESSKTMYICKAELIEAALAEPRFLWSSCSGYVESHPRGGRYILRLPR